MFGMLLASGATPSMAMGPGGTFGYAERRKDGLEMPIYFLFFFLKSPVQVNMQGHPACIQIGTHGSLTKAELEEIASGRLENDCPLRSFVMLQVALMPGLPAPALPDTPSWTTVFTFSLRLKQLEGESLPRCLLPKLITSIRWKSFSLFGSFGLLDRRVKVGAPGMSVQM
eukprot:768514-Hanusia_phi.AAC.1